MQPTFSYPACRGCGPGAPKGLPAGHFAVTTPWKPTTLKNPALVKWEILLTICLARPAVQIYGGARQCSPGWAGWRVPSGALSKPFTIRVAGRGIIISPASHHPSMNQYTAPVRSGGAPRSSDPAVGPPYPRPRGRTRSPGVCARGRRRDGSCPHSGRSP